MPVLLYADGRPVKDAEGNPLKTGQTVTDDTLGDCIVRGTVPLDKGEGLNVVIDWLGPRDPSKPKSRTVGRWAPSLSRSPLRRRVSSRSSISRSSTSTARQDLLTSLLRTTLPARLRHTTRGACWRRMRLCE
jgi:hypothetical protein